MADLARAKKGIILFHDIQPSTARAIPALLADLKAKGYRVVHLKPKADATTMPEFDAIAQRELDRRRVIVSSEPLVKRSLTWQLTGEHAEPAVARSRYGRTATLRAPPRTTGSAPAFAGRRLQGCQTLWV